MLCLDYFAAAPIWIHQRAILESISVFVDHSRDLDLVDNRGATALCYVCWGIPTKLSFHVIRTLVNRGSALHHRDSAGVTPFELLFCSSMTQLGRTNWKIPTDSGCFQGL